MSRSDGSIGTREMSRTAPWESELGRLGEASVWGWARMQSSALAGSTVMALAVAFVVVFGVVMVVMVVVAVAVVAAAVLETVGRRASMAEAVKIQFVVVVAAAGWDVGEEEVGSAVQHRLQS